MADSYPGSIDSNVSGKSRAWPPGSIGDRKRICSWEAGECGPQITMRTMMTAVCRCFARGPIKVGAQDSSSLSGQTILILPEPYLSRDSLTASSGAAVTSSAGLGTSSARLLQVQIQTGKSVHIRISVNGDDTIEADTSDPIYSGENIFMWGPAHFISFLEAT